MESLDFEYLKTWSARGRFVTIVFGVLSVGLAGHAYENSLYNQASKLSQEHEFTLKNSTIFEIELKSVHGEAFFLSTVSILLIYSVISLLCHTLNEKLTYIQAFKEIDIGVHVIGTVVLAIAGGAEIISSTRIAQDCEENIVFPGDLICQYEGEKISAGVFGILNSFAYVFVGYLGERRLWVNNQYNSRTA